MVLNYWNLRPICCSAYLPVFLLTQPFGNSFTHCAEPCALGHIFLFLPPLLQFHHPPPPPPASCQTGPPCSLHPYWRMEKQSSRNSPDNYPPVIFSSCPSCLPFCAFSYSFPFQSIFVLQSFLWTNERRKNSSLIFYFVLRGTAVRASTSVHVGFPELEIRLTDILMGAETGRLSSFLARCCHCLRDGERRKGNYSHFGFLPVKAGVTRNSMSCD